MKRFCSTLASSIAFLWIVVDAAPLGLPYGSFYCRVINFSYYTIKQDNKSQMNSISPVFSFFPFHFLTKKSTDRQKADIDNGKLFIKRFVNWNTLNKFGFFFEQINKRLTFITKAVQLKPG
ncbi:hypothetical protein T4D_14654 [Trichinella pseudospiralis]|uniref:Secreted protein n=1 Tax=Trichinella pseudospiralis TaxID=6337 RepID=A0A0V1FHB4_TRIPS|nr:hypothetical protein T4D_14654 [Trichinella pseudospiralis]